MPRPYRAPMPRAADIEYPFGPEMARAGCREKLFVHHVLLARGSGGRRQRASLAVHIGVLNAVSCLDSRSCLRLPCGDGRR